MHSENMVYDFILTQVYVHHLHVIVSLLNAILTIIILSKIKFEV